MFEIRDLHAYYGKSHVVQGISLEVKPGEAVGLMGRNGVGKTTTLRSIMGIMARTEGSISLDGVELTKLSSDARARHGIGYVPEDRAVFPQMSVEENLRIGAMLKPAAEQRACLDVAYDLFPILRQRHRQLAGTLSGGQQKMLALARALGLRPKLLLVDEPSEGLMPQNVDLITQALQKAVAEGVSVLVVDASISLVSQSCSHVHAMDGGTLVGTFDAQEITNPEVLAGAVLGETR